MPTAEELDSHYGSTGPVEAARQWLTLVLAEADYEGAWTLTDPVLRLARAQAWIYNNHRHEDVASEDRDGLAVALAQSPSTHPLWISFAQTELQQMNRAWAAYSLDRLGAWSRPRPMDLDHEVVIFSPSDVSNLVTEPTLAQGIALVMHFTEGGWLVAALGDRLPVPGWPPQF